MGRHARITLLLAGVAVLLALLSLWPRSANPPDTQAAITGISSETISRIRIERPGAEAVHMERHTDGWRLTAPLQAPAHPARVNGLLSLLGEPSLSTLAVVVTDLARFQLEPPNVTLYLDDEQFEFGDSTVLDSNRYLRYRDTVHVVADTVYFQFHQDPGFFVDTRLLPPDTKVRELRLPSLTLTRVKGSWHAEPALPDSDDAAHDVVREWRSARALTVRRLEDAPDAATVIVETADGTFQFQVRSSDTGVILARPALGIQYHLDADVASRLLLLSAPAAATAPER